jgi:hypothetical protein
LQAIYRSVPPEIPEPVQTFLQGAGNICYCHCCRSPQKWDSKRRTNTFVVQEAAIGLGYTACAHRSRMHKFNYRTPRYAVDFPVQLTLEGSLVAGRCTEISTDGMQLELHRPLPPDFCGVVALAWHNIHLELRVRLAHTGSRQDALRFIFESEKERAAVADLVARLADPAEPQGEPGLVLVR